MDKYFSSTPTLRTAPLTSLGCTNTAEMTFGSPDAFMEKRNSLVGGGFSTHPIAIIARGLCEGIPSHLLISILPEVLEIPDKNDWDLVPRRIQRSSQ
jgi:hypothetical protein